MRRESRTSEIGTNVTHEQIEICRAPIATSSISRAGPRHDVQRGQRRQNKFIASGGQPAEAVNVFVDGATYKNDVLTGRRRRTGRQPGQPVPAGRRAGVPRHHPELQGGISEGGERDHHRDDTKSAATTGRRMRSSTASPRRTSRAIPSPCALPVQRPDFCALQLVAASADRSSATSCSSSAPTS